MAIGDVVKTLIVRFRSDGAAAVKDDLDSIAARAAAISKMDPAIKVKVDKDGLAQLSAMRFQLQALKLAGDKAGIGDLARRLRDLGDAAQSPRVKLSALQLEMQALKSVIGKDDGGGLLGSLLQLIGKGGAGGLGAGGIAAGGVAGAAGLGGVAFALLGIVPAVVAAGAGLTAFAGLSYPIFTKITAGYAAITGANTARQLKQAWAGIPAVLRPSVQGLLDLAGAGGAMTRAIRPLTLKVFNEGLSLAGRLLPTIVPLAQGAGNALSGLLAGLNSALATPVQMPGGGPGGPGGALALARLQPTGWQQFIDVLTKQSGPAITTIGRGLAQVAGAMGQLLIAMSNPASIRVMTVAFEGLAAVIKGLAAFFAWATPRFSNSVREVTNWGRTLRRWFDDVAGSFQQTGHAFMSVIRDLEHGFGQFKNQVTGSFDQTRHAIMSVLHDLAHGFDEFRHQVAGMAHDVAWKFDTVRHAAAVMGHDVAHYFDDVRHFAATMGHDVATVFDGIRGTIARWVADVGTFVGRAVAWFKGLPGRILAAVAGFGSLLFSAGAALLQGLVHGIESSVGSVISTVIGVGKSILGGIGHALGIGSPSRITYQHGLWLAQGLAMGMDAGAGQLGTAAARMASAAVPGGGAYGGGAGVVRLEWAGGPPSGTLDAAIWTWLRQNVRVKGGGGPQSVQRALGVVQR